ncbi:MAG: (d)CMP kinase [Verrucomicrobia bacterium]|nr:MAG: (d)CMP kinase [Verrucomicrobiota bacterium]
MPAHYAIAIDGPAASGKSTLARNLADRLGLVMVNSGAMYRAITWQALRLGIEPSDHPAVVAMLDGLEIICGENGIESTILINGIDPSPELRHESINAHVSEISAIPQVRERLVALQRGYLEHTNVIMEGRDIGTVVFPDTPYKIFVIADQSVRTHRRVEAGEADSVLARDVADSSRATSPLRQAEDAVLLDTSHHDIETAVQAALVILRGQGLEFDCSLLT